MSNQDTPQRFGRPVRAKRDSNLAAYVGPNIVAAFAREAKRRNMPISRLVARVLQCVASGKLFDAVLDQEEA